MVAAKLDHSRVLVTKFHQNRLTLKGRSAGQRHTDKPVGFYGPIAPPVPNVPSSDCPHASFNRCTPPRRRFNQNIPRSVVLLEPCHCRNRHRGKLQNLSRPSVLFESSRFFYSARNGAQCLHCKRCISYSNSVRLSVHPSYAGIVSKRRHVARCSLHCWIAKCV